MFSSTLRRGTAALLLTASLGLVGCLSDGGEDRLTIRAGYSYDTVIVAVTNNVVYPTYVDLAAKGALLETAVIALNATPNEATLSAARQAWRDARAPWERSEGFLFGPVDEKGIDPSIDSWPLDSATLKNVLTTVNADTLTVDFVTQQADEVKGFHAIEYLLFGIDSNKTAASITAREHLYLKAAAGSFKARVDTLRASWDVNGGNYTHQFTVVNSQRTSAENLLEGMIGICNEVATGKITDPYDFGVSKEESRFSRNSTLDFANNIRSVRNVYLGTYGGTSGKGVKTWVLAADSVLAVRVEAEIDSAISKVLQMGDFAAAISTTNPAGRAKVAVARTSILKLKATLEGDVKPAILP
jgi:putative iron-regulated protein